VIGYAFGAMLIGWVVIVVLGILLAPFIIFLPDPVVDILRIVY